MCVVSMVLDHYTEKWATPLPFAVTPAEVDEFRKLLDRSREYDRQHSQPDCELKEKKRVVLELAEKLGVEIDFL